MAAISPSAAQQAGERASFELTEIERFGEERRPKNHCLQIGGTSDPRRPPKVQLPDIAGASSASCADNASKWPARLPNSRTQEPARQRFADAVQALRASSQPWSEPASPVGGMSLSPTAKSGLLSKPSTRSMVPEWWKPPTTVLSALDSFDDRHRARVSRAEAAVQQIQHDPTSKARASRTEQLLWEIRYNRVYFDPKGESQPRADGPARPSQTAPPAEVAHTPEWQIEQSVWAKRRLHTDSRTFTNTEKIERKMFEHDWEQAMQCSGFVRAILRADDDGAADADNDGVADELAEVKLVLWEHHQLLYRAFDYYASCSAGHDIFRVHSNSFAKFAQDCAIPEPKSAHISTTIVSHIFIGINSGAAGIASSKYDDKHTLSRNEWLQCIVKLAIAKYVDTKRVADVSEALYTLCNSDIDPNVPMEAHHDADEFRRIFCYTPQMDATLRAHDASLRRIFNRYAKEHEEFGTLKSNLGSSALMQCEEWLKLCNDCQLIDAEFTLREATLVFVWSRLHVVKEEEEASRRRMINLCYEDFLEAIVRSSTMKALPTDELLRAANFDDAGQYMLHLREANQEGLRIFYSRFGQRWFKQPKQPIDRCVVHMISLIIAMLAEHDKPAQPAPSPEPAKTPQRKFNINVDDLPSSSFSAALKSPQGNAPHGSPSTRQSSGSAPSSPYRTSQRSRNDEATGAAPFSPLRRGRNTTLVPKSMGVAGKNLRK
uniref:Uncharacterized protein n=1 Tax=Chrysotila carterae TaxID=13221 RepID=A0A7S4C291_CHRCT|mmetsp:Transcript_6026/g.13180  ORF Transcript_6026/g.13180 Transcript_6026/m.13180 type:complete len:717 (+) Transcript_6026:170-2320(+)